MQWYAFLCSSSYLSLNKILSFLFHKIQYNLSFVFCGWWWPPTEKNWMLLFCRLAMEIPKHSGANQKHSIFIIVNSFRELSWKDDLDEWTWSQKNLLHKQCAKVAVWLLFAIALLNKNLYCCFADLWKIRIKKWRQIIWAIYKNAKAHTLKIKYVWWCYKCIYFNEDLYDQNNENTHLIIQNQSAQCTL